MHSSATRRRFAASSSGRGRRVLVAVAGLVVLGGTIAITQFAAAEEKDAAACAQAAGANLQANTLRGGVHRHGVSQQQGRPGQQGKPGQQGGKQQGSGQNGGGQKGGGQNGGGQQTPTTPPADCPDDGQQNGGNNGGNNNGGNNGNNNGGNNNGLDVLGRDCAQSDLAPHTGFQEAPRCVTTAFGEVSAAARNPQLLISKSPEKVRVNQAFQLRVSTRNLVRDRFLGAAAGGYYLESSFLNDQGLQRGHFHAACRMLQSTRTAPNPEPAPEFFRAVEDGGGGATPDEVVVDVPGLPRTGTAQCAVWAGDGSHRLPMMERANQTPAFDVVRVRVTR